MSSAPLFNPRDRLRGLSIEKKSEPLHFHKDTDDPDKIKADAVSRFLEKTLEFKLCKITFDEYRQELIKWFPLINGLGNIVMKVNVNVIVAQDNNTSTPQQLNTSTPQQLNTSTPQQLNTSTAQQLNTSTALNFEVHSHSSDPYPVENSYYSPMIYITKPPQLLNSHAQKIRSYWNSKNPHVPHPFKKLTLRTSKFNAEKAFIESLDMSGKTTKIL